MNRVKVENVNKKTVKPAGEVFESIHTIMHLFRSAQYRVLRDCPYELTHMEGKLLGFFARHPGATLRDLVAHMKQDKGQMARLIRDLKDQGLLSGEGDAGDRRSVRLQLTAEGKAIHKKLWQQVQRLADLAVEGLSDAETEKLAALLRQVRENLAEA